MVRSESDVGPICDSLCSVFEVKFVPTRVRTITRELIYDHFVPLADCLVVAKCFNQFAGKDLERTPFFFKIFFKIAHESRHRRNATSQCRASREIWQKAQLVKQNAETDGKKVFRAAQFLAGCDARVGTR